MNEVLEKISAIGIVPVIKIDDVEKAIPLAQALCCLLYTSSNALPRAGSGYIQNS